MIHAPASQFPRPDQLSSHSESLPVTSTNGAFRVPRAYSGQHCAQPIIGRSVRWFSAPSLLLPDETLGLGDSLALGVETEALDVGVRSHARLRGGGSDRID